MEESRKMQLIAIVEAEVQTMMRAGDRAYLQSLERPALLDAVEPELRFMGLYSHSDQETPRVIRTILEEQIDQLCDEYLYTPEVKIEASEFCVPATTSDNPSVRGITLFGFIASSNGIKTLGGFSP